MLSLCYNVALDIVAIHAFKDYIKHMIVIDCRERIPL